MSRILLAGLLLASMGCRSGPPQVTFAKAMRETLTSALRTNGKLEPVEASQVRSASEGAVRRLAVKLGQHVNQGDLLAELDPVGARTELAAAQARLDQAQAELAVLDRGGSEEARVEIENGLAKAKLELEAAQKEEAATQRLLAKDAATRQEADAAVERVKQAQLEIEALGKKQASLASSSEKEAAQARVREAQAAVEQAQNRIEEAAIRAPMSGVVFNVAINQGAFLHPGDEVAQIGKLDRMRAIVYVDEPELGRVSEGQRVEITWDGDPGRSWQGEVERMPTEIVAQGSRQVGEVACLIGNPDGRLAPGANINAEILTRTVDNALTIPREALRRRNNADGVFVLDGDKVAWKPVKLGISSITRVQVLDGLQEGDEVALSGDVALEDGMTVIHSL